MPQYESMIKKNNTPTTLVILGATGYLVSRKIIPAVFRLYKARQLPDRFRVIGFSRRDLSDVDFREYIRGTLTSVTGTTPELINAFIELVFYTRGEFETQEHYADLARRLTSLDDEWGTCPTVVTSAWYAQSTCRECTKNGLVLFGRYCEIE